MRYIYFYRQHHLLTTGLVRLSSKLWDFSEFWLQNNHLSKNCVVLQLRITTVHNNCKIHNCLQHSKLQLCITIAYYNRLLHNLQPWITTNCLSNNRKIHNCLSNTANYNCVLQLHITTAYYTTTSPTTANNNCKLQHKLQCKLQLQSTTTSPTTKFKSTLKLVKLVYTSWFVK
jgi:hypothetical protein